MQRSSAMIFRQTEGALMRAFRNIALVAVLSSCSGLGLAQASGTVRVDTAHVINSFDPDSALGSSIDVLSRLDIGKVYTPHIIQESLSAGWGPITYRN